MRDIWHLGCTDCDITLVRPGAEVPEPVHGGRGEEGLPAHHDHHGLPHHHGQYACLLSEILISILQVGWLGMVLYTVYADCDPITAGQVKKKDQVIKMRSIKIMITLRERDEMEAE